MMMPKRMQIAPTDWMGVKVSFRKMTPRMAAMSGLSAVNRPAFSALVYFWATGWKVKPKTEQMNTKARMALHVVVSSGMTGRSNKAVPIALYMARNPICKIPNRNGSHCRARRAVRQIQTA